MPVELVIHYIVKDYQRMFLDRDNLLKEIERLRAALVKKQDELVKMKWAMARLSNPKIEKVAYKKHLRALEARNRALKNENDNLHNIINRE